MSEQLSTQYTPNTEAVREQYTREQPPQIGTVSEKGAEFDRWHAAELAAAEKRGAVRALKEAADYAASGAHCAEMWVAPPSTIHWLQHRADQIEEGE